MMPASDDNVALITARRIYWGKHAQEYLRACGPAAERRKRKGPDADSSSHMSSGVFPECAESGFVERSRHAPFPSGVSICIIGLCIKLSMPSTVLNPILHHRVHRDYEGTDRTLASPTPCSLWALWLAQRRPGVRKSGPEHLVPSMAYSAYSAFRRPLS